MTREVRYREVRAEEVPARTRRAAEAALSFARVDLSLASLELRWFAPAAIPAAEAFASLRNVMTPPMPAGDFEYQAILGRCGTEPDGLIWVRSDLGARATAAVVFHECHHAAARQLVGAPLGDLEREGRERLAQEYEANLRGIVASIVTVTREKEIENA